MSFSIFTIRSREVSSRLRLLARGFQFSAIVTWTITAVVALGLPFAKQPVTLYRWMFPSSFLLYEVMLGASMFLIGRALLRRERWGAYLAGFTLAVPFVRQILRPDAAILSIPGIIGTTVALVAIVTVWNELGSVRDTEFSNTDTGHDNELTPRNRGFGEPRSLPFGTTANMSVMSTHVAIEREPVVIGTDPVQPTRQR